MGWTETTTSLQSRSVRPTVRLSVAFFLSSCSPVTTRPDFPPFPQATSVVLMARRERIIPILATLVAAESLRVRRASPVDGYLETDWYDTRTHRSFRDGAYVPDLAHAVKLRCWADPYVPSETILTIEAAYRPRYDPSRTERDLEAAVPEGHDGYALAAKLLAQVKEKFATRPRASAPSGP